MLKQLENLYLHPNHWAYFFLEKLSRHWIKINIILFSIVCIYPIIQTSKTYYHYQYLLENRQKQKNNLEQQNRLLESLQKLNHEKNQQDGQLATLNQQIKELIEQQNAIIDTLQWRFDNGKQIELILQHQSSQIFGLIEKLVSIKSLNFKSISLLKLNQQKLIQLNTEILVP